MCEQLRLYSSGSRSGPPADLDPDKRPALTEADVSIALSAGLASFVVLALEFLLGLDYVPEAEC